MKLVAPVFAICLALSLGCVADEADEAKSNKVRIDCHLAYRANPQGGFDEKKITVEVPVQAGEVPEIARTQSKTHAFDDMKVELRYDVNMLVVHLSDIKTGKQIWSQLYQLQPGLRNQFAGGHGFTGLSYIYHPTSETQLQTWSSLAK